MGSPAGIRPADAIVVGAGPNGLAAAVTLARAGLAVHVIEGAPTPGGGCRTQELTLPGFRHDVCSAVHPLAAASPFFQRIDLAALGATLRTPKVAFAHPLDGGRAGYVAGSVEETAGGLGADGPSYRRLLGPLVRDVPLTLPELLAPMLRSRSRASGRHGPVRPGRRAAREPAGPAVPHRGGARRCSRAWPRTPCSRSPRRAPAVSG